MASKAEKKAWVQVQKKTFTRWVNVQLSERMKKVTELIDGGLDDGIMLCNLLEVISSKRIKHNKVCRNNFHKTENLNAALKFMRKEGLVLVNTGSTDIQEHNERIILGMIWTIILRYQINKGEGGSPKQDLLDWVNKQIAPYGLTPRQCRNFTRDFQNGEVLNALCDSLEPGLVDMKQVIGAAPMRNNAQALNIAESDLGIPPLLDPADIVAVPEEHSMMAYVAYFRDYLANKAKDRIPFAGYCYADGPGVEGGKQGTGPLPFEIHTRNRKNVDIPEDAKYVVQVFGPDGSEIPCNLTQDGSGVTSGSYEPTMPGNHRVSIKLDKKDIKDSTYRLFIKPSADPTQSYAEGPGVEEARDDEPGVFTVHALDPEGAYCAGANPIVQVTQSDGQVVDADVVDNDDGTYSVTYPPPPAGPATITVQINDQDIKDTPVELEVTKGISSENTYADGPGVEGGFVGRPLPFCVHACDDEGNPLTKGGDTFTVDVVGPNGKIPVSLDDNQNGEYPGQYVAPMNAVGTATVSIVNNRDGQPIKDAPFTVQLKEPADHSKSYAEGPGLVDAWDDRANCFTVYAIDRHGQPVIGEDVKVLLAYGDQKLGGGAPAPVASNEPEFIEQKVNKIAKFCASCGEGNQKAKFCWSCGAKTAVRTVVERVKNPRYIAAPKRSSGGSVEYTEEGTLVDNGDGTYSAEYLTGKGKDFVIINVHINGKGIQGVPVKLAIAKGPCAENCYADGPGVEQGFLNRPVRFKIHSVDEDDIPLNKGGDNYEAIVTDPNGDEVPTQIVDNGDGTYSAQYKPVAEGPHNVLVNLLQDGEHKPIRDMPMTASIRKGACAANSYMRGKGIKWAYEGRNNVFTVYAFDEDGQPVAGEKVDILIVMQDAFDEQDLGNKVLRWKDSDDYKDYGAFDESEDTVDLGALNKRAVVDPTLEDNGDGTYTVTYTPTITGPYVVDCRLYDEHVRKSPANVTVYFNCPHKECQDAMAVLHDEILAFEDEKNGVEHKHRETDEAAELASLRAILAGKQKASNEGIDELRAQLEDEQTARQAAEDEVARLRELLQQYE